MHAHDTAFGLAGIENIPQSGQTHDTLIVGNLLAALQSVIEGFAAGDGHVLKNWADDVTLELFRAVNSRAIDRFGDGRPVGDDILCRHGEVRDHIVYALQSLFREVVEKEPRPFQKECIMCGFIDGQQGTGTRQHGVGGGSADLAGFPSGDFGKVQIVDLRCPFLKDRVKQHVKRVIPGQSPVIVAKLPLVVLNGFRGASA